MMAYKNLSAKQLRVVLESRDKSRDLVFDLLLKIHLLIDHDSDRDDVRKRALFIRQVLNRDSDAIKICRIELTYKDE